MYEVFVKHQKIARERTNPKPSPEVSILAYNKITYDCACKDLSV